MATENRDVEILATWLFEAIKDREFVIHKPDGTSFELDNGYEILRLTTKLASVEARLMYNPRVIGEDEEDEDWFGVRAILVRFACKMDELNREHAEDNKS